jgi:chitinase
MFADQYPYAGGNGHYAAYLENTDGYEAELVAPNNLAQGGSPPQADHSHADPQQAGNPIVDVS